MSSGKIKTILGASFLAVLMHSFCCIFPLIVVLGGVSGIATSFSWIEAAEPYLMAFSFIALSIAFYQTYKPKPKVDCECDTHNHKSILGSKAFLWITTIFTIGMYILHHSTDLLGHIH